MPEKKIVAIFVLGILVISGTALSGCVEPETDDRTLLRMGFSFPTEIDPNTGIDFSSNAAALNLYDPLLYPSPDGVDPWIAEDWWAENDGRTWTFELRDDVEFHSGRELDAEDVMFSMKRYVYMGEGFGYLFYDSVDLEESEVIDDHTISFELTKDFGVFEHKLSRFYIFDRHEIEENTIYDGDFEYGPDGEYGDMGREYLIENDAGSGPYQMKDIDVGDYIHMEKFEDYWGPMDDLAADEFRMLAVTDPSTTRTMFAAEELEITAEWLPHEVFEDLVEDEGAKLGSYIQAGMRYGMMHTRRKPLDCRYVRKAISYAIDYETVNENIFAYNTDAEGLIAPTLPGMKELDMPERDLDKAQEALEQSEYYPEIVDPEDEDLEIEYIWMAAVPATERLGVELGSNLGDIGLELNVRQITWGAMTDAMRDEETSPDIVPMNLDAHYADAGGMLESRYHSVNAHTTEQNEWLLNDTLDQMIEDAMNETDDSLRYELYEEVQEEIYDMYTTIYYGNEPSTHAYQEYVEWPHMEEEGENIPAVQYYIEARNIRVLPHDQR